MEYYVNIKVNKFTSTHLVRIHSTNGGKSES